MMELHEAVRKYLEISVKVNDHKVALQQSIERVERMKEKLAEERLELEEAEFQMIDIMKKKGVI
jgi:hypothetical protein